MKQHIAELLQQALHTLEEKSPLSLSALPTIQVEHCRDPEHGDYACNIALALSKTVGRSSQFLAEQLVSALPESRHIAKVEIAGPGFINFTLDHSALHPTIEDILSRGEKYGHSEKGSRARIHMEYVSANPTGPLHVGHGRGAAYGACTANLLKATGYTVHREYYVNDAGRQMQILALSIWLRYLEAADEPVTLPSNAYQGDYIRDIAKFLMELKGFAYVVPFKKLQAAIPEHLDPVEDKETYIDVLIESAKKLLGHEFFKEIKQFGLDSILTDIQEDLREFGVVYDEWFLESALYEDESFEKGIQLLKQEGHTYEKEGALWFKATELGDDKDRVLIRENGQPTYFASDVAYHLRSYLNYDQIIDVLGADHHGYIARLQALLRGAGKDPSHLHVLLVQFAVLYRGKEKVSMSTRSGDFITLRQLREEVGNDAARFFYIMRKPEQHLDFDLELAKSKSNENPVYYIQYAHARICSVFQKLSDNGWHYDQVKGLAGLALLDDTHERQLMLCLFRYKDMLEVAAQNYAPHQVAHYLLELANLFHSYYNASAFLVEEADVRQARLTLILACQYILANGLMLLGVSAPKKM